MAKAKKFEVRVMVRVELEPTVVVKAETEEQAQEMVEQMIAEGLFDVGWQYPKSKGVKWSEGDMDIQVDNVEEM